MYVGYYISIFGYPLIIYGYGPTDDGDWLFCSESELFVGTLEELLA